MNWSNKWGAPVAPEFAKPQLEKITEEDKQASEWVKSIDDATSEAKKVWEDAAMYGVGFAQGGKHVPRENVIENWKPDDELPEAPGLERLKTKVPWMAPASVGKSALQIVNEVAQNVGYETRSIKLGNKTISVTVVGDLGLDFCEPGEKDQGWNIYHLPTLACFSGAVPSYREHSAECKDNIYGEYCKCVPKISYDYDKPELLRWMARVQENYPTSWQMLRLLTPDTYKDNGASAKEIIQQWCLSVKVE